MDALEAAVAAAAAAAALPAGSFGPGAAVGGAAGSRRDGRDSRNGSGTRSSGTPLWRITMRREQQRDEQRCAAEEEAQQATAPDGFVHQADDWYFHPKHGIFWRSTTRKYYSYNEDSKATTEVTQEPSAEKELRLLADASSVHRHERMREDRHVIVRDLAKAAVSLKMPIDHLAKPVALFAIYDGHRPVPGDEQALGGSVEAVDEVPPTCAEFCARNFHLKLLPRLSEFKGPWGAPQIMAAIRDSFDELDADFLARPGIATDGCSAVVALLTGRRLFVASIGEAVGYLGEEAAPGDMPLLRQTVHHTPTMPQEMGRIAAAGGAVIQANSGGQQLLQASRDDRSSDTLHIARAFGDRTLKTAAGTASADGEEGAADNATPSPVIATPDIVTRVLDSRHHVLVLASGGILALTEGKVAEAMSRRRGRPRVACKTLLRDMQAHGATGSLTALCVFFDWSGNVPSAQPPLKKTRTDALSPAKASQVRCRQILVKHRDCKEPIDKVRGNRPVTRSLAEAELILLETLEAIEGCPGTNIFSQRCKEISECITCMKGGEMAGDLGWITRGQLHTSVEAAAFALPVGHISDIVESDEGVHVLWRIA